jgi:hypothetical protein
MVTETGYRSGRYIGALTHIGLPYRLDRSGGWAHLRRIGDDFDATGAFPTLWLQEPRLLRHDLDLLAELGCASFVCMLPEPAFDRADGLERIATVRQYVAKPTSDWSPHARRNARKAAGLVDVELADDPLELSGDWCRLYDHLRERHAVDGGFEDFPGRSLVEQLLVPGARVFAARLENGSVVGMLVWMRQRYERKEWAGYALGAYSPGGYSYGASYALFAAAYRHFADEGVDLLDLGRTPQGAAGLERFKLGLGATPATTVCAGRVLRPEFYARLLAQHGTCPDWFPAYRNCSWDLESEDRKTAA